MGLPFVSAFQWLLVLFLGAFAARLVIPVGVDESLISPADKPMRAFNYIRVPIDGGKGHLNVIEAGPKNGTLMVLLHGFPQSAALSWENQIPYFARQGYRVLAPDQRGYNNSYSPEGRHHYHIDNLVQDVSDVIHFAGRKKAVVMGHDWGGGVAWRVAETRPDLVWKLVIVAAPHRKAFREALTSGYHQALSSWYMLFFQLPILPEYKFTANYFAGLRYAVLTARPHTWTATQLKAHISIWKKSLTTMMNWYRAIDLKTPPPKEKIAPPTRIFWGEDDYFLTSQLGPLSVKHCANAKHQVIHSSTKGTQTTHWVAHEEAKKLNEAILLFTK